MYGIVGFIDQRKKTSQEQLQVMRDTITYRGPDSAGDIFIEGDNYYAHRRLSILDLSTLGSQLMSYKNLTIIHKELILIIMLKR